VNGALNMLGGTRLSLDILTSATSDKLNVTGTVFLATAPGPILSISGVAGFNPAPNEVFPIILNDFDDLVSGTFEGLAEGAALTVNGIPFNISYSMNLDGGAVANDIGITAVPEPGSVVLLLGGFGMLIGAQRKRSHRRN
jgi:hypothetical protein